MWVWFYTSLTYTYICNVYLHKSYSFNVHFFQKPLRTWEKIEDHRTSIKEHAFKVKRQLPFLLLLFCPESVQKWSCEWSFVFLHVPVSFLTNVDIVNLLCAISSEHKLWKLFSFLFYYILKVSWSLLVSLRQFSFSLII